MFLKNCFIFIIIIVVVQGRPYTTNSGSSNIQVAKSNLFGYYFLITIFYYLIIQRS